MTTARTLRIVQAFLLAIIMLAPALAANDPGHDTLYVEQNASSEIMNNFSLNVTGSLHAKGLLLSQDYLDILANGTTISAPSRNTIAGTSSSLNIDSPGSIWLNRYSATGAVHVGAAGGTVNLNVSGALYVQGSTLTVNGLDVCLEDGTNCPATGGANSGGGWINTTTVTSTSLNVGIGTSSPNGTLHVTSGQILIPAGSVSLPAIAYQYDNGTGFTFGDSFVRVIENENEIAAFTNNLIHTHGYAFLNNAGLRITSPGFDNLSIYTNDTERLRISQSGLVGIGTGAPSQLLDVNGSINISGSSGILYAPQICLAGDCRTSWPTVSGSGGWTNNTTTTYTAYNVGIKTSTPSSALAVNGSINLTGSIITGGNISIGIGVKTPGSESIGIGSRANASSTGSISIGTDAITQAVRAIAIGDQAYSEEISIGRSSLTFATGSIAIGAGARATDFNAIALGYQTRAVETQGIAIGYQPSAIGTDSIAIGTSANATGGLAVSIGYASVSSGIASAALGPTAFALGNYSIAIGILTTASNNYTIAIGSGAAARGISATAIGTGTFANGTGSLAIGTFLNVSADNATIIGVGSVNSNATNGQFTYNNIPNSFAVAGNRHIGLLVNYTNGHVGIGAIGLNQRLTVNGSINITDNSAALYVPQICLAGDCRTSWPSGSGDSGGWTNTSETTATALNVNITGNVTLNSNRMCWNENCSAYTYFNGTCIIHISGSTQDMICQ